MKKKVLIKYHNKECVIEKHGSWYDLKLAENLGLIYNNVSFAELGVAMKLPKGYEAIMVSRSSTPLKYNIIQSNCLGVMDSNFNGDGDIWRYAAHPISETIPYYIKKGTRIAQFRIQLEMDASFWVKITDLFYSGYKFIEVDKLGINRGGFGSSG